MSDEKRHIRKIKLKAKTNSESVSTNKTDSVESGSNKESEKNKPEQVEITLELPNEKRINYKEENSQAQNNKIYDETDEHHYVFTSSESFDKDKITRTKTKKKKKFLRSFFPSAGDSAGEIIRKLIFIISFAVMIICVALVAQYLIENYQNEQRNTYLESVYRSSLSVSDSSSRLNDNSENDEDYYKLITGASKLLEINKDVAGYISIPDTGIDYPLMQGKNNNDEYLKTDIYGNSLRAGSIFLDYRNVFDEIENGKPIKENSDVLVVYGHNMRDESMFGKLKYYKTDDSYYSKHPLIELNSNYREYKYKIFGIFISDPDDDTETFFDYWNTLNFNNKDEFYKFINEIKRRTIINTNVDMKYGDQLLLLSTCNNAVKDGRLVVAARLVRDGEDELSGTEASTKNTNAKMPSSYYGSKQNTYDESKFVPYEEK